MIGYSLREYIWVVCVYTRAHTHIRILDSWRKGITDHQIACWAHRDWGNLDFQTDHPSAKGSPNENNTSEDF